MAKSKVQKVTINLPAELLKSAMKQTGEGITETVREGLKLLSAREAYAGARSYEGKYNFSIDLNKLRED